MLQLSNKVVWERTRVFANLSARGVSRTPPAESQNLFLENYGPDISIVCDFGNSLTIPWEHCQEGGFLARTPGSIRAPRMSSQW